MPSPSRPSPADLIDSLRNARELNAVVTRNEIVRWLTIASLALPAVMRAASAGNVTCREAMQDIAPLLPPFK